MEQPARPREQPDTVSTPVPGVPLQRSAENRVIGGVCGGLGEYTDVDPIIYRVLTAVLTVVGGAGLILYGAAMLLVPDARTGTAPLGRLLASGRRGMRTAGLLLTLVGLLVVLGGLTGVFGGASLSIVVIAGLAVLVAHRRGVNLRQVLRGGPQDEDASAAPGETPAAMAPPWQRFAPGQGPVPVPPAPDAPTMRLPPQQPGGPGYVDLAALGPSGPGRVPGRQGPTRRHRPPSITGLVWLLAAATGGGIAWLQHVHRLSGDIRVPLAVALGVLGLGLVVSTWVGRASVKGWGVLLTLALGAATVVSPTAIIHGGTVRWTPSSAAQLADQQPYEAGIGAATLDLGQLPLQQKRTYPARVKLAGGRLVVLVPRSASVDLTVRCKACAGTALGYRLDGTTTLHRQVPPARGPAKGGDTISKDEARPAIPTPVIDLDISAGAGNVEVRRAA